MLLKKIRNFQLFFRHLWKVIWLGLLLTSACIRLERIPTATPVSIQPTIVQSTQTLAPTNTPDYGWEDVNYLMESVCFEAAMNVAGQVFKISDANALQAFYTQLDRNQTCEDPINRVAYPFNNNESIVGLWSEGIGCTARHEVQNVQRDDTQRQETIQLQFVTEGNCPYELLQPFWIAVPQSTGYNFHIEVQPAR